MATFNETLKKNNYKVYYLKDGKYYQGYLKTLRYDKDTKAFCVTSKDGSTILTKAVFLTREDVINNHELYYYDVVKNMDFGCDCLYAHEQFWVTIYKWIDNRVERRSGDSLHRFEFDFMSNKFLYADNDWITKLCIEGKKYKDIALTADESKQNNKIIFVDLDEDDAILKQIESVQNEIDECTRKLNALRQTLSELQN